MTAASLRMKGASIVRLLAATFALWAFALQGAAKNKGGEDDSRTTRPFIAQTHVIAPERVGEFVLEGSQRYDKNDKFGGVAFRYQHPDFPQLRIDLFVYPIGERETEKTLDAGLRDFLASMQPAVDAGMYRNVKEGDTVEFDLDLSENGARNETNAPGTGDAMANEAANEKSRKPRKISPKRDAEEKKDAEREALLAKLLAAGKRIDGRRMSLSYDYHSDAPDEWFPMRSRTYLFYRQLHYFKGRISAAESQIDEAAFAAFTDRAMRELVPAVQAYNIGSCGDATIYVNADAPKEEAADQLMRNLIEVSSRNARNNCHGKADDKELTALGQDAAVETFTYSATDWNAP